MCVIKKQILDIPASQIKDIDSLFGQMAKINMNEIPNNFKSALNYTRELAYNSFKISCIIESYGIDKMDDKNIILRNGKLLVSDILPEVFAHAFEIGFIVATLQGYDEIDAIEDNMLNKLFLDNWGTAFIGRGNKWAMQFIAHKLEENELYITHAFSPGQNKIPIEIQDVIFNTLNPAEIGVSLSDSFMIHPKKSVSGIFGIQTVDEDHVRPCDLCNRRNTCPTAFS